MKVSIIIAVKSYNDNLEECLKACLNLNYPDFEVIVVPDWLMSYGDKRVKILHSGPGRLPAKKRDIGAEIATGEILAFLDDDAYPEADWLTNAVKNFSDINIAAVGGPAVTPPNEDFYALASGLVYESFLVSGNFRYRYTKEKKQFIDDYPSCNLLIRKDTFDRLGGFKTNFWPGEDTFLCMEIVKAGFKIVYDPDVLVYHHRRKLFSPHLKQIASYALHRGYFAKVYPQTSLRWQYFVPSIFILWIFAGSLIPKLWPVYLFFLCSYLFIVLFNAFHRSSLKLTWFVFAGIIGSHFTYGIYFIYGLTKKSLEDGGIET